MKTLKEQIKDALLEALDQTDGNQKDAAKLLGLSPRQINYMMKTHGIRRPSDQGKV